MTKAWWLVTFPGVAIALTVLFINMVARWLRSVSDHNSGSRSSESGSVVA
jgi:ABC-type dipeptide/oligopeptide/nickel transport system permease subunit